MENVYKKYICKKISIYFKEDLKYSEDRIFMMNCLIHKSIIFLNEFKYNNCQAIENYQKYLKIEYIRWSYNFSNLMFCIGKRDVKEIIKFLIAKFRLYKFI